MRWPVTWLHLTRVLGVMGLTYEIVVDKTDKPSVMIVVGAMILGTESVAKIFNRPKE